MIFSKIGKVYHSNLDFSANWECFRSIGNFLSQLGKNLVPKPDPVLYREKALSLLVKIQTDNTTPVFLLHLIWGRNRAPFPMPKSIFFSQSLSKNSQLENCEKLCHVIQSFHGFSRCQTVKM